MIFCIRSGFRGGADIPLNGGRLDAILPAYVGPPEQEAKHDEFKEEVTRDPKASPP